jgi:DNA repair exonuclease SbcCD nuclease subunit
MVLSRAIIIGDIHIKTDNMDKINRFIKKINEVLIDKKPDFIVLLGDILDTHERLHTTCLNKAYELINILRNNAKTYILVGNHDYESNTQYLNDKHWLNGMKEWKNIVIADKVIKEKISEEYFIFVPYVYPGRFIEALNTLGGEDEWLSACCIFAHQEFFGSKFGAIVSVEGDKWDIDYPNVISGHIHKNQKPQHNIYYCGSSIQVSFGETDKNVIPYIEFMENKTYELEEIDLKLPCKKIIYLNIDDVDKYVIPDTEDDIKITLNGEKSEFETLKKQKKYKEIIKKGIKVVFKPKKNEIKLKNEKLQKIFEESKEEEENNSNFGKILAKIIDHEKETEYLKEIYEIVINNKNINLDDILIL